MSPRFDPLGRLRGPHVSLLIPAYLAERFIDRTLHFARGQTHERLRIIVSVDAGEDATADIARRHAAADRRVEVHEQSARLGWAGNVNFLLERVQTPCFCIYFHDDILLPQYTERLLRVLRDAPDAAGAYCDMGHFGASDHVSTGPPYHGDATRRLLTLLLSFERGSPLRALLRTARAGHLRLREMGSGGFWANEPFLMDMVAAGPLEHLKETLYLRWNQRDGGLTDGWKKLPPQAAVDGWRANIDTRLAIAEAAAGSERDSRALRFALFLHAFPAMQALYEAHGPSLFASPAALHPIFAAPETPAVLDGYGEPLETCARQRYAFCMKQGLLD